MEILDITTFMHNGMVSESSFFDAIENHDWNKYRHKRVLVKGCGTTIIPPWAFMAITARLTGTAKKIRYGNEHSSVPIFDRNRQTAGEVNHVD